MKDLFGPWEPQSTGSPVLPPRPAGNPDVTASFDLLWKGIEVTTGAQREHRYDVLCKQAEEKGLSLEPLRSYLDCFRFGMPPTAASAGGSTGS